MQVILASIIKHLCTMLNFRPIFVGGSGGGFASLVQSMLFADESVALVWNPQTSIERYEKKAVLNYLNIAFQDIQGVGGENIGKLELDYLTYRFAQSGILHDLCSAQHPSRSTAIYLQNRNDWHLEVHAKRYLERHVSSRIGSSVFLFSSNILVHFGDWGPCHEGPPQDTVVGILLNLRNKATLDFIACELDTDANQFAMFDADLKDQIWLPDFKICEVNEGAVISIVNNKLPNSGGIQYAIYWYSNGNKNVIWYQSSPDFNISCPLQSIDALCFFIKDSWGEIRSHYQPKNW